MSDTATGEFDQAYLASMLTNVQYKMGVNTRYSMSS